ncbi:MAG: VWA domain-containing protein [Deltaproteobacteria bacterium]|nr:VWA domain-containing protein [Deltaproteobacteria bacterium]MBW2393624.1 VWA domain-containing protein [Deltaproteobacteria bacterium]
MDARPLVHSLLLLALTLTPASSPSPMRAASPSTEKASHPFLEIDAPALAEGTTDDPLFEVRGHGGNRRGDGHDVVIALDVSESTLLDSGLELDGDGPSGTTDPALIAWLIEQTGETPLVLRLRDEQDFEDTVLAAELEAARALASRLDPARFRVGVVTFAEEARVVAPLGATRNELASALANVPRDLFWESAGTNYQAAVEKAHDLLRPPLGLPDNRLRSIVFLSDGAPTRPLRGNRAERYALEAAVAAGRDDIRLFAFAIGPEAESGLEVLARMTGWTSGRLETVTRPGLIVNRLRQLDLVGLAHLEVSNLTTGEAARALRVFPDGSFDAFVELTTGTNELRFLARDRNGKEHEVLRRVEYRPGSAPSEMTPAVASGPPGAKGTNLKKLRTRTAEIEALAVMEARRLQAKDLQIRAEERSRR